MVLAPRTSSLPKLPLKPGRWTVGSAATCSYRIAADGVRPRHALVMCGGQTIVLKAWDSHTWHNGQPVQGEVRLHTGDRVTIGSVEFSIEAEDTIDRAGPPGVPQTEDPHEAPASVGDLDSSNSPPEGWDLERLREQIQELRDDLSQRMQRRSGVSAIATTPITSHEHDAEPVSARIIELQQAAAEARRLAAQAHQDLAALRDEHARRETHLRQVADELRPELETTQQVVADLRRELETQRSDAAQRELAWEQQASEWSAEREQWQEEMLSLANTQQRSAAEWEQRQSALHDETTRWQNEAGQLREGWRVQQAAWSDERSRLQNDLQQREEAVQQSLRAVTQREQDLAEHSQQLLADRQRLEADRQLLQAERSEREQAVAALVEERQRVEQHATEVLAKFEGFPQRLAEFEQQHANLLREQQTLEHSWNWLQSDRKKLVDEKEEWQQQRAQWQAECERSIADCEQLQRDRAEFAKDRDHWQQQQADLQQLEVDRVQLATDRQQLQIDQSTYVAQCEEFAAECRTRQEEWEAAEAELHSQQQALHDELKRRQEQPPEREAQDAEVERERREFVDNSRSATLDPDFPEIHAQSWNHTSGELADDEWKVVTAQSLLTSSDGGVATEAALPTFADPWSIGVDLTAPRETHAAEWSEESQSTFDGTATPPVSSKGLAEAEASPTTDRTTPSAGDWPIADVPATQSTSDSDEPEVTDVAPPHDVPATEHPVELPPDAGLQPSATSEIQNNSLADDTPIKSTNSPLVSILESMAFTDDEDVDESVSRYMQHLLARSQQPGDENPGSDLPRSVTRPISKSAAADSVVTKHSPLAAANAHEPRESEVVNESHSESNQLEVDNASPVRLPPVHAQNKDALRAATEQMRQVANQQTVKNVEAANWKQIKQSIKTKLVLAAFSFLLSAGLLYWGYHDRPEFLVLGLCASGLGVMTWLDLLVAIRRARSQTSKLAGRKKKTGPSKS